MLLLLGTVGLMFMTASQDLIVFFLALETMSMAVYVLAGYDRRSPASSEAGLKYFLIGAFASGFLLYGIALLYGSTGSTNLALIGAQFADRPIPVMGLIGMGLLLIGFGFKVAAVPFHMWTPDVYEGAPTPVTGFMATGVKAAAFVAFARVLLSCFPQAAPQWRPVIWVLAVVTMILGNLVALNQTSLKRLLAYSSVAHAGISPGRALAREPARHRVIVAVSRRLRRHHIRGIRDPERAGHRRRARHHAGGDLRAGTESALAFVRPRGLHALACWASPEPSGSSASGTSSPL